MKTKIKTIAIIFLLVIFLFGVVTSQTENNAGDFEVSYCCEKTKSGAWCQNAPIESCDSKFRKSPTSCDATAYCKMGCCYDSQEGTCMENSPQKICEESNGVWADNSKCEIPQCDLGCCVLGEQAAFVTQVRCKRLSSVYGLETDFRIDIQNEMQCIASTMPEVKGACVFEQDFEKTCRFTTKKECEEELGAKLVDTNASTSGVSFYEGVLCSDETLGTNCGPTEQTICVEEKDEVYFVDSCGNLANIYDAAKIKNKIYWSKVFKKDESCGYGADNANSATCGNCDYYLGSTCKSFKRGEDKVRPNYGDNICRDLSCEYDGKKYEHGETWCADSEGTSNIIVGHETALGNSEESEISAETENLPGSRYFRMVCYNGEVSVEPCADFRQEVCIQDEVNGFRAAACRANMWQDCFAQTTQKDCENGDLRDCVWLVGDYELNGLENGGGVGSDASGEQAFRGTQGQPQQPFSGTGDGTNPEDINKAINSGQGITGHATAEGNGTKENKDKKDEDEENAQAICVQKYPPGYDFWQPGDAQSICPMASQMCIVKYEKKIIGGEKCIDGCECLEEDWAEVMNKACISMGDCGSKTNYLGVEGYNTGYAIKSEGEKKEEK